MNIHPLIVTLKKDLLILKDRLTHELTSSQKSITEVTQELVQQVDQTVLTLFSEYSLLQNNDPFCLLAIGGYGRSQLQLHSDVDLLIVHSEDASPCSLEQAQQFIQSCWDVGLEISHQMTTVSQCALLASKDLSVISSLLDMRVLCGDTSLKEELRYQIHPLNMWSSADFFYAKQHEQANRYKKYDDSAYHLEPNIKYGPGGLRDLQILLAIAKRHLGIKELSDGINSGFITVKEYEKLNICQQFLMTVRFALHGLTRKREDRLLFDHQLKLATLFGYQDDEHSLGIERFMKRYFSIIKQTRDLNDLLLQYFSETFLQKGSHQIIQLNQSFQISNHHIEIREMNVFENKPNTLIELFVWLAKRPDLIGIRAGTIRLIRNHLYLLSRQSSRTPELASTFLKIFKTNHSPYHALVRMNQYGVLGAYLPCFDAIIGQMQYDLFHAYTVDQHALFVIRNLARFEDPDFNHQFPLAAAIMPTIQHKEILYLSGLFHDIAKGRGGDHSNLGAQEALSFAHTHFLQHELQDLLVWLVEHHLLMSQVAQRKDIYDPETIHQFCKQIPHTHYLDYLYLLTVADICATNPTLWNTWKDSLLKELYRATKQLLQAKNNVSEQYLIKSRCEQALKILSKKNELDHERILKLWANFKGSYFLHESPNTIAKHTKAILNCKKFPLVLIMPHHSEGGTEILIYMPHCEERFTITTTIFSNHHLTVQEANITTCYNAFNLDTYIILNEQNQAFLTDAEQRALKRDLVSHLGNFKTFPIITKKRVSRSQSHFHTQPKVTFNQNKKRNITSLILTATDKPGLLAQISQVFLKQNIHLYQAKIATIGERIEDTFYMTNSKGNLLSMHEKKELKQQLLTIFLCTGKKS